MINLFRHRGLVVSDSTGVMRLTMIAAVPQVKAKRKPFWLTVKDNSMPRRDWSKFDAPLFDVERNERKKPRVNVARRKIEAARNIPDMKVPSMLLRRQAD